MATCNSCNGHVSLNAYSCPHCGSQTPHAPAIMGKVILAGGAAVVLFSVLAVLA